MTDAVDATSAVEIRSSVKRSATILAVGALVYLAGDLFDVVGILTNPYEVIDVRGRADVLTMEQTAWDVSHVFQGSGHVIAAVGLWGLGLALARAATDGRGQRAATVAAWAGLATAVWAINSFLAIVRSPTDVAAGLDDPTVDIIVTGAVYLVSVLVAFVGLGLVLRRLEHLRWLGWTLTIVGPLTALSIAGAGPSLPATLMLIPGLALAIRPYPPT